MTYSLSPAPCELGWRTVLPLVHCTASFLGYVSNKSVTLLSLCESATALLSIEIILGLSFSQSRTSELLELLAHPYGWLVPHSAGHNLHILNLILELWLPIYYLMLYSLLPKYWPLKISVPFAIPSLIILIWILFWKKHSLKIVVRLE